MWRREDGSVVDISMEPGDERGILRLISIRSSVAGAYTCEVRAESGELARRTVRIEVHSKSLEGLVIYRTSLQTVCSETLMNLFFYPQNHQR